MEREPKPKIEQAGGRYTVYCQTEGRTIYQSSGFNKQIENIIARHTAQEHANQLGHKVYIFENGKII